MTVRRPVNPDSTELIKLSFEACRQLTVLNAGSIVVIGTFLSDIFPSDSQGTLTVPFYIKLLLGAAFVGFGTSLISATASMTRIRAYLSYEDLNVLLSLLLPWLSFSGGLICFGVAVLLNLFFGG